MIWVLACSAVLMVFAVTVAVRTAAVFARHRAETAADLAALAAAGQIGEGDEPCTAAATIAHRNAAELTSCAVELDAGGRSGTVTVGVVAHVRLPLVGIEDVGAGARAGRLPSAAMRRNRAPPANTGTAHGYGRLSQSDALPAAWQGILTPRPNTGRRLAEVAIPWS